MNLQDDQARVEASSPYQSFIVQAPAGSGKTELLSQRFLRLLSKVQAPEQIVALTFTRKAASEMRERILSAIKKADEGKIQGYALDALNQDKAQDWQLLKNPSRLRIMTIDALCYALSKAIPLYEQHIPYAALTETPDEAYQQAVRACLAYVLAEKSWQPRIQLILEHLDNRQDNLLSLLSSLLANRDQWLGLLFRARGQTKEACEELLSKLVQQDLQHFLDATPWLAELRELCLAMGYCQDWQEDTALTPSITQSLASLLLTKDNKLRKGFDHHVGLTRDAFEAETYEDLKKRSKALLSTLATYPQFLSSLITVSKLPEIHYAADQWRILQVLLDLLPLLTAHLHLLFQELHCIDFIGITEQALLALGEEDAPTDLALFLDNAIHHLLVDEFQDTSLKQYELLEKLVQSWLPSEGKTLFLVGDPMQSIYRFRQAEVGLFLRAKTEGIGNIPLKSLELCSNFRSEQAIVNWVNQQFKSIFPSQEDASLGAVSFHPSVAIHHDEACAFVSAKEYVDKAAEAEALALLVAETLDKHPDESIAILVRSRSHLSQILPILRAHKLPVQGVEIEKLSSMSHMLDLWSLTKALLLPADRLAWLSLLRSPYGGLTLADLLCIATYDRKQSIYFALSQLEKIMGLSEDGRKRAAFVYHTLNKALSRRHQQSFAVWIEEVVFDLFGDKLLTKREQADLEQFYLMLEQLSGPDVCPKQCESAFYKLYSKRLNPSRLQVMTIHKSKGLEFDTVILPGLGNKAQKPDKPLLRWLNLTTSEGQGFLLSPLQAAHQDRCLLYDYVGKINEEKEQYEQQRLLYVAVTRAKKRLYLLDGHEGVSQGTFRALLSGQVFEPEAALTPSATQEPSLPLLSRLPTSYYQSLTPEHESTANIPILLKPNKARLLGVLAHEILQWLCTTHPVPVKLPQGLLDMRLKSFGLSAAEQEEVSASLNEQLGLMLQSPIGEWICKPQLEEQNEYALMVTEAGKTVTKIIDRTFIEHGQRWIIDFKTGTDSPKAQEQHRQQVTEYARIFSLFDSRPIHCGLYYLSGNHWLSWEYEFGTINSLLP